MAERAQDQGGGPVDEAVAVIEHARSRVPADFLFALAIILGLAAAGLLVAAVIVGGTLRDLFLNLGVEVIGALLTVVVIDGLWRRREAAASSSLDEVRRRLNERRRWPMTPDERRAWRLFVDEYQALLGAETLSDRLRALPKYRRRLEALESQASRTLARFQPDATNAQPRSGEPR